MWLSLLCLLGVASEGALLLDIGPEGAPVLDGFSELSTGRSTEPRARWATPPKRTAWTAQPDALTGDWATDGVLELELAQGEWYFALMLGQEQGGNSFTFDPGRTVSLEMNGLLVKAEEIPKGDAFLSSTYYAANPFPVFKDGETVFERQVLPAYPWRIIKLVIDTPGSTQLSVRGAPLQGLIAAQTRTELDVWTSIADDHRRAWFARHVHPQQYRIPAPDRGAGSLRIAPGHWRDLPSDELAGADELVLRPARGERVTLPLWILGGEGEIDFEWTQDTGPPLDVGFSEIHWLDARGNWERALQPRPSFLRPVERTLRANQGVIPGLGLSFEWDEPKTTASGRLVVRRGEDRVELPVQVQPRDLDLRQVSIPLGMYMDVHPILTRAYADGGIQRALQGCRDDFSLLNERGLADAVAIRWAAGPQYASPPDLSLLHACSQAYRDIQPEGVLIWADAYRLVYPLFTGRADTLPPASQAPLRAMAQSSRDFDAYLNIYDEDARFAIDNAERVLPTVRRWLEEQEPEVLLAGAMQNPFDWPSVGELDIHVSTLRPPPTAERFTRLRARGSEAWAYNLLPGRGTGLQLFALQPDGLLQWHLNDVRADPFHDGHARVQMQYAMLAPDGHIWSTPLLESLAEGVTDLRYLEALEYWLDEAEPFSRRRKVRDAYADSVAVLELAKALGGQGASYGPIQGEPWTDEGLEALRSEVAASAEALRATLPRRVRQ